MGEHVQPACLKLIEGSEEGFDSDIILMPPKVTVGRSVSNTVIMKSLEFSRSHCEFYHSEENRWFVKNLSQNGLKVNDTRIDKDETRELENNDIIALLLVGGPVYEYKEPKLRGQVSVEKEETEDSSTTDFSEDDDTQDPTPSQWETSELEKEKESLNLAKQQLKLLEIENKMLQFHSIDTELEEQREKERAERQLAQALEELKTVKANAYNFVMQSMTTSFNCPVCNKLPIQPVILNCGHTICTYCHSQHEKDAPHRFCPKCKYEISYNLPHFCLRNFVAHGISILPQEFQETRKKEILDREKEEAVAEELAKKAKAEEEEKLASLAKIKAKEEESLPKAENIVAESAEPPS